MKRPVRGDDGKYNLKSGVFDELFGSCLLYTSPSPRD